MKYIFVSSNLNSFRIKHLMVIKLNMTFRKMSILDTGCENRICRPPPPLLLKLAIIGYVVKEKLIFKKELQGKYQLFVVWATY